MDIHNEQNEEKQPGDYSMPGRDRRKSSPLDVLNKHIAEIGSEIHSFRKARGRGLILKYAAIFIVVTIVAILPMTKDKFSHIAMINIDGPITKGSPTGDGSMLSETFEKALNNNAAKAIVIRANSGGGSPVQAEIFYKTLMDYRKRRAEATPEEREKMKDVYVTISDVCASACVFIVSGADYIYAHSSSIVGSIGVKMESWGFTQLMEKVGVQKRVLHKGAHKNMLSPYHAPDLEAIEAIEASILSPSYELFKNSVVAGRKKPEMLNDPELFSGLIWGGDQALGKGLVDDIKTSHQLISSLKNDLEVKKTLEYNAVATPDMLSKMLKGAIDYTINAWMLSLDEKSTPTIR